METHITVMGIDASTRSGVVCLSDDPKFYFSTELENKKLKGLDRVVWFKDSVGKLLDTYKPILAVIEDYGYANSFTLVPLVEIGTVVRLACRERNINMVFIPPTSLKSAIANSGSAKKELMLMEIYKRWGFEAATNNIADAYGLAKIGQMLYGLEKITKESSTRLSKIESVTSYMAKMSLVFS